MTLRARGRIAIGVGLLLVVSVAVFSYLSSRSDSQPHARSADTETTGSAWEVLQKEARRGSGNSPPALEEAELRAFRVLHGRPEPMPHRLRTLTEETLGSKQIGLGFESAQYIHTSGGGIWLVSGEDVACLVQAVRGALACDTIEDVVDGGLLLVVYDLPKHPTEAPRHFLALGVAPDWAKAARLAAGSTIRTVAVHDNAYALRANAPISLERLESRFSSR